ncbi:hypothetical protein HRR14_01960 [Gardnerella vaginalis]|jgi:hypothetical protein|uniref:Uncharacterized protein n=5 Tax=Gardnerella TaxID=2701 RepID=A0A9X7I976_9BIFI|nr:hypothetical protein [Gardnerella vaginalis]EPI45821.1 hypothetical protein HMPREF1581_01220 [Gardnerella vaginalis JCP8108]EPI50660.1 hypothetical protein HMPREF1577_01247 [Gardnerella pickettii JCP8017A]EPI52132.1 hypothetical protein HMPREF1576_00075 [Gardnerella pickettii JCP7719]EPI54291.1 hypothetical protein HMPREF1573_01487 [Gardnerella vaginalis JCP7276]EPI56091.1 hypothetical protein HMPREF1574_00181 [Gardnerella pickettii JCP7659]EPI60789.1 hypothetical protein HMPREF1578_01089 
MCKEETPYRKEAKLVKHKIVINVTGENGEKKQVLRGAVMRLPQRFIRWLFGDYSQVYLLDPGKSVQSVDVKEV